MENLWEENYIGYYIYIRGISSDRVVAQILHIPYEKYIIILKEYRAFYRGVGYYFKVKEDVEAAIEILTPYIIMAKLTEKIYEENIQRNIYKEIYTKKYMKKIYEKIYTEEYNMEYTNIYKEIYEENI